MEQRTWFLAVIAVALALGSVDLWKGFNGSRKVRGSFA